MRGLMVLMLWMPVLPLAAQQSAHPCASVAGAAARLACYDAAYPPSPDVIEAAAAQAQAEFGFDRPAEPLRTPGLTAEQTAPDRIESQVTRVDHAGNGQRSFTLENGQVWTQTESRSNGHVRAGQTVQLRKGVLGAYQLVTSDGVFLRVRRAR